MIRPVFFICGVATVLMVAATAFSGQAPQKTTNSGVFTAAQADRGKAVFESKCTTCHDPARFIGDVFLDNWNGKPLKDVWDIASGTMPEDNPGSLKPQEYGDILAYFLHLNGFATGDAELQGNAGAMASIQIEKPKKAGR